LGYGETEARAREELARELRQQLDTIEAAVTQRAAEQVRLEQLVQDLRGRLAQLDGQTTDQVAQIHTELDRMRGGFVEAGERFRGLHGRLGTLESTFESLHGTVGGLEGTVASVKGTVGSLEKAVEQLTASRPKRLLVWRENVHLWVTLAAVATLTATAGAIWLYA